MRLLLFLATCLVVNGQVPFSLQDRAFLSSTSPLRIGLAGYWRLEEASGTRYDFSATGAHLASNNSVGQSSGVSSYTGNCASFIPSSSQSLSASSSNLLQYGSSQPLTLAAWVHLTNGTAAELIAAKFSNTDQRGYALLSNNGKPFFQIGGSGSGFSYVLGTTTITNQAWHLVIATYAGTTNASGMNLYVDNSPESVTPVDIGTWDSLNTAFFTIGNYTGLTGAFANGLIDEVGLWTRVLTASERTQLYNAGLGTHFPWAHP